MPMLQEIGRVLRTFLILALTLVMAETVIVLARSVTQFFPQAESKSEVSKLVVFHGRGEARPEDPPSWLFPDEALVNRPLPIVHLPAQLRSRVIFLELSSVPRADQGPQPDILACELARQTLLMTMREEMGFICRDQGIGDSLPENLPGANRFRVSLEYVQGKIPVFTVSQTHLEKPVVVWNGTGPAMGQGPRALLDLLAWLEIVGRKELPNAFARAGLSSEPAIKSPELNIPRQKLFSELDISNQFMLARLLHADLRNVGESPERIGKLVQCYSHLGMLSQDQWAHSDKVFKARALAYAQRMCAAAPQSSAGLWHRAYALAFAGQHALGLDDLAFARDVQQASEKPNADVGPKNPRWLQIIDALCRFDDSRLPRHEEGTFENKLWHFLDSYRSEHQIEIRFVPQRAKVQAEPAPKSSKRFEPANQLVRLQYSRPLSHANPVFDINLVNSQLGRIPELREALGRSIVFGSLNADALRQMRTDLQGEDTLEEPSLATLAKWIEDEAFLQAAQNLPIMRENQLGWGQKPFRSSWSVLADHPDLPYLKALAKRPGEIFETLRPLPLAQFDCRAQVLWNALRQADPERWNIEFPHAANRSNSGYSDLLARFDLEGSSGEIANAKRLLQVSPYSPTARATLIVNDWNFVAKRVPGWKLDILNPAVSLALGAHYLEANQYQDAELYLQFAEASNETSVDLLLAETYKKSGQTEKWVALAKKLLSQGGEVVDGISIRIELAEHYLKQKQYQKALLYAETAADSWQPRAMKCAVECYYGLGEWELAELWNQRLMVTVSSRN